MDLSNQLRLKINKRSLRKGKHKENILLYTLTELFYHFKTEKPGSKLEVFQTASQGVAASLFSQKPLKHVQKHPHSAQIGAEKKDEPHKPDRRRWLSKKFFERKIVNPKNLSKLR